jgi:hypothetical protein
VSSTRMESMEISESMVFLWLGFLWFVVGGLLGVSFVFRE